VRGDEKMAGEKTSKQAENEWEKHSVYHIDADGFEKALLGMFHMIQTVPLGRKCRIVLEYDPASPKASIETFIDKSDEGQAQGKPFQWVPYNPTSQ